MELPLNVTFGLGFLAGVFVGLLILEQFYRNMYRTTMNETAKMYANILNKFGIKRNSCNIWEMKPLDKDEVWTLKKDIEV